MRDKAIRCIFWLFFTAGLSVNAAAFTCPTPTAGLPDIKAFGYYSDGAKSERDDAKFKESHDLTKPFEDFATRVSKLSDDYLEDHDPAVAACTIAWLDRWAQDGAMLGQMVKINNDQSQYVRKWTNGSAAIAWNKVRDQAGSEQRDRIDAWLKAVSNATLAYWTVSKATRNNHYYWTGVGVMATAVATGDQELLAAARRIYEAGLSDMDNEGVLPHEMKRGVRALHYHNFSAMPLVMIAEMARKVKQDWFALREGRLDLLVARVASGMRDPAWFERKSGVAPQIIPPTRDLGWVSIYQVRRPKGEQFEGLYSVHNNSYIRDLGGTVALMVERGVFDPH